MQKAQVKLNKILVIQTAFIGDAILATALFESIHHSLPEASIDVLVRKGNESLFHLHPFLNEVLIWDKKQSKYKNLFSLLKKIRASKYDLVINLQRFGATGLLTALSGAKITVGYDKNPFSFLFTKKVPHELDKGLHEVDRNNNLVAWFASTLKRQPKLYPNKEQYERVEAYIHKPFICAAPNSVWFTKQYPEHKWVEFLNEVPSDYTIYLLGAPGDAESCERIKDKVTNHNQIEILAGKLSFLESAALMEKAVMNYVNDSAPMHIASSMNASVAAIFCSTVPAFGFGPLSDKSFNIETAEKLSCRPCGLHGYKACPEGHFKCAEGIEVQKMLEVIEISKSDHANLNTLELALLTSIAEKRKTEFPFIAAHIPFLKVKNRNNTGIGLYIHFVYSEEGALLIDENNGSHLVGTGQTIELDQLESGMSFALDIENGKINMIEIVMNYVYESWDGNFDNFKLVDF